MKDFEKQESNIINQRLLDYDDYKIPGIYGYIKAYVLPQKVEPSQVNLIFNEFTEQTLLPHSLSPQDIIIWWKKFQDHDPCIMKQIEWWAEIESPDDYNQDVVFNYVQDHYKINTTGEVDINTTGAVNDML